MSMRADRLLAPAVRAWARFVESESNLPVPLDEPWAEADGPDPDRLLLCGSGPAVGWGVLSHQLALPGALARALHTHTHRGVRVDLLADPKMTARSAPRRLARHDVSPYQATIVLLGINEALALEPIVAWRRHLVEVIDTVRSAARSRTRIVVLGVPPLRSIPIYDAPLGAIAAAHARRLNEATIELCGVTPGVTFVPMPADPRSRGEVRSRDGYAVWAAMIADRLAPMIELDRLSRRAAEAQPTAQWVG